MPCTQSFSSLSLSQSLSSDFGLRHAIFISMLSAIISSYTVWDQARLLCKWAMWRGFYYNARDHIKSGVFFFLFWVMMHGWNGIRLEILGSSVNVPLPSLKIRRSILPCNFVYSLFSALDRIAMSGEGAIGNGEKVWVTNEDVKWDRKKRRNMRIFLSKWPWHKISRWTTMEARTRRAILSAVLSRVLGGIV